MQGFLSFLSFLLWVWGGILMWHRWIVAALWQGLRRSRFSLSGCSAGNSRRIRRLLCMPLRGVVL